MAETLHACARATTTRRQRPSLAHTVDRTEAIERARRFKMKPQTILTICIAVAVFVPVAQATAATKIAEYTAPQSSSTRAELIRGDALNRRYHLGAYRQTGTRPTVAELRAMTIRG